jgi:hypothetical protein
MKIVFVGPNWRLEFDSPAVPRKGELVELPQFEPSTFRVRDVWWTFDVLDGVTIEVLLGRPG